jgi:hypothetical protein
MNINGNNGQSSTGIVPVSRRLQDAADTGLISDASLQALEVIDMGALIQAGLGVDVQDVTTSEVTLVSQLIDDSASIRFGSNAQIVREGHNAVLDALNDSKQANGILMHARYLNGKVLYPYCLLNQAIRMDARNYDPNGSTPLYDQTAVLLGTVVAKVQEFEDNNVPVRAVTLIVTDGADCGSQHFTPHTLKPLIRDLLQSEMHIVAGLGISDGSTDFRRVFRDMGLEDEWILTPAQSATEIRAAFRLFSQSAVRASQGGAAFGQTAMGGFGSP